MPVKRFAGIVGVVAALFTLTGCFSVVDSVVDGAASGVGRAVYERTEQAVYKSLAPEEELPPPTAPGWGYFMAAQAQIVFSYAFSAGGYWPGQTQYEPGEWTEFSITEAEPDSAFFIERALLKRTDEGNEWWRVSWTQGDEEWVYEGLISPEEQRLVRLRGRDTNGNAGEIPVGESPVYHSPTEISGESLEGAKQGTETVSTPAGSYNAMLIEYMNPSADGTLRWWTTEEVPGGVVKYQTIEEGEVVWTGSLNATGTDATTQLESF